VLDWGHEGLSETLRTLDAAQIAHAGAGNDAEGAAAPATPNVFARPDHFGIIDLPGKGRVLLFSFGSTTSGIPGDWRATSISPGVNVLEDLSEATATRIATEMRKSQQPGDLLIASIHWGSNWGHEIPREQIAFAHRLIEEGVALVHGHSSHHVKAIEVFKGRLILYGCGDFITDYEGISGYEDFRGDIAVMYLVDVDPKSGALISARLVPMHMQRFRLAHTSAEDAHWLCELLKELGKPFGTTCRPNKDNSLTLECQAK
jgi:poly-gamma-glutamate synthesis protein (capsule biosynthesis protein)